MKCRIRRPWQHRQATGVLIVILGLGLMVAAFPFWVWTVVLGVLFVWLGWFIFSTS